MRKKLKETKRSWYMKLKRGVPNSGSQVGGDAIIKTEGEDFMRRTFSRVFKIAKWRWHRKAKLGGIRHLPRYTWGSQNQRREET